MRLYVHVPTVARTMPTRNLTTTVRTTKLHVVCRSIHLMHVTTILRRRNSGQTARRPHTVRLSAFYGPLTVENSHLTQALGIIVVSHELCGLISLYTNVYSYFYRLRAIVLGISIVSTKCWNAKKFTGVSGWDIQAVSKRNKRRESTQTFIF